MLDKFYSRMKTLTRRQLFGRGGLLVLPTLATRRAAAAPEASPGLRVGLEIYQSIGVRPLINCRGTLTIVGGSLELPEVRAAKDAAAQHYVQLDELMDGIGKRLSQLTGAEWGIVTSGCAAALAHATAACVAGGNPDRHVRIPNLTGFPRDEVIIPRHSRNVYDAAVRSIGVRVIEVDTVDEFQSALGPRTAMVYILAGPRADASPLSTEAIAKLAAPHKVPILVDAAAEILTIPSVHLQKGATLVGYSGGKCMRGPQCAGLLLGRKDLVRAAWIHSAPHHGYGRAMKLGKEEAIGMLAAVEAWVKRDHKAEYNQWMAWMDHISKRVSAVPGVTASVREPRGLSNHTPSLGIRWDSAALGITGKEVSDILWDGEPRIALGGGMGGGGGRANAAGSPTETGIGITAYMMMPGDDKIVADRIYAVLSNPPRRKPAEAPAPPATDLSGRWDVHIEFQAGDSDHALHLRQVGARIEGTHQGDFVSRDLSGSVAADQVELSSAYTEQHGDSLMFRFSGKVSGDSMSGTLDMGEYLKAKWTARRHVSARA